MKIPFNKPYYSGREIFTLVRAAVSGHISGNGIFTKKCHRFFEREFGFKKSLLTSSCTDALEMTAILSEIKPGDEVIMPSFTFMSTANAFLLRGAVIRFADTLPDVPNIDPAGIEALINQSTKAIVVVHYSGIACDMDAIMNIARKHNLMVIEDAAHAIGSYYKGKVLGSIGQFGTFSFHETKNIISGEGGMLSINDETYSARAEIIWEKGTNRAAFYRGEVDKYGWVDLGSSFLPSEMVSAFLFAQLSAFKRIQKKRINAWKSYYKLLKPLEDSGKIRLPVIPYYAHVNGNMFYILAKNEDERNSLLDFLKSQDIHAVFHYLPLHQSPYFINKHDGRELPNTVNFSECILRLPFYTAINQSKIKRVCKAVNRFYSRPV